MLRHPQKTDPATGRGASGAVVCAAARIVGGGQLHSLPLSSGHADHGCGRQPALRARRPDRPFGVRAGKQGDSRKRRRSDAGRPGQSGLAARAVRGGGRAGDRIQDAAAARRGAVVPSEHRAQHPGGVPRIPAVVAAGSAARHPVRGVPVLRAAVRAGGGIHPLLSGPGFRDSGGRNSRDQRCAEGRDHRDRHLFPTAADDRRR